MSAVAFRSHPLADAEGGAGCLPETPGPASCPWAQAPQELELPPGLMPAAGDESGAPARTFPASHSRLLS